MLFLRWYLWVAPNVLVAACLVGFLRRRDRRQFPVFIGYCIFTLAAFAALLTTDFLVQHSLVTLRLYRVILVALTGVSAVLELWVLYELASEMFLSHSSLAHALRPFFRWVLAIFLLIAAAVSAALPEAGDGRIMNAFEILNFSSNLVKVGLLLSLLLFSRVLQLSWKNVSAGIVLGFGVSAAAEMIGSALISTLGKAGYVQIDLIRMTAFHVCALIWTIYAFLPERAPAFAGGGLQQPELEFWNQEAQRMVRR
ncbi:MAG TPA: hypothetical protein VFB00_06840 [Terriglobales bacterium]|nr:hypothetical protein [Terriglobales bacterium]